MKVKRRKQAKHLLSTYRNYFGFCEPFRILVDGTFCRMSVQYNVPIKDQIAKYLQSEIECLTTRCVLAELEMLGETMYGAKIVAQRCKTHKCSHRKKPVTAQDCLKSLLKDENSNKFFLATQDFELTKLAAKIPGVPLLYFHQNNVILDKISLTTSIKVNEISQGKAEPTAVLQNSIKLMKQEANLISTETVAKKKRKRTRGQNPLSCKKSKKVKIENHTEMDKSVQKRGRKRSRQRKFGLTDGGE